MNKTVANILGTIVTSKGKDQGLLFIRVLAGVMMFTHGVQKAMNFSTLADTFPDPIGLGGQFSLVLIMLAELVGSAMLVLGLFTRLGALALMIGMCIAAFVAHAPFSLGGSELPLLYLVVCTGLFISGAGRFSADFIIGKYIAASKK